MQWVDDQTLQFDTMAISVPKYLEFVKNELNSLKEFLRSTVMFNIPLEEFNALCDSSSLGVLENPPSMESNPLFPGNSCFYNKDSSYFLLNKDAISFVAYMIKLQLLGLESMALPQNVLAPSPNTTPVEWDDEKCHQWLSDVHTAWERAYCLYHTTSGLPGRTTEEVILRMTHSASGPVNLFVIDGKLQTQSDYNKSSNTTGLHKHITRVFHPTLAHIFLLLIMCVRPLELQVLRGVSDTDDSVDFAYTTMLFASWGKAWNSKEATEAFSAWLQNGLSLKFTTGIAFYRQFATVLQRKWLYEADSSVYSNSGHGVSTIDQFDIVSKWWQTKLQLN